MTEKNDTPPCQRPSIASFGADRSGDLTYGAYLKVPELLSLQQLRVEGKSHDELLFIILHQTYELWFRQILHEITTAQKYIRCGQLRDANRLMQRILVIGKLLLDQLDVLGTMRPRDFGHFREALRPASGFQSAQFRELEAIAAVLDPKTLEFFPEGSPERITIEKRKQENNLLQDLLELFESEGFAVLNDDGSHKEEHEIALALVPIYQSPENYLDIYELCESIVQFEHWLLAWRYNHVRVVERIIGMKGGTGGSPGVAYLNSTLGRRAFHFLIEVRSHLDEKELFGAYRPPSCD